MNTAEHYKKCMLEALLQCTTNPLLYKVQLIILASVTPTDVLLYSNVKALAFAHLKDLRRDIGKGAVTAKDQDTKIHFQYLKQMLDKIVNESPIPGLNY